MIDSNSYRIAIVEDDFDLRQSMEECLLAYGYQVWSAGSAETFYRQIVSNPVDLVILDIGLPGEDGLSVAQHLREIAKLGVIVISGRVEVEDRLAGLRAGADCYLTKPVNLDELLANIKALFRRTGAQSTQTVIPNPPTTSWRLDHREWLLFAPNGKFLKLTSSELILMKMLTQAQGEVVSKDNIADKLFKQSVANPDERIAVLISRLRSKVETTLGYSLPIKAVHQVGYVFTESSKQK